MKYNRGGTLMENKVAKLIKYYAYINAAVSLVSALVICYSEVADYFKVSGVAFFLIIGGGIVSSVFIYAVGEIIDLLQAIKNNTSKDSTDSTLPPL